jgi:hypothetical protein
MTDQQQREPIYVYTYRDAAGRPRMADAWAMSTTDELRSSAAWRVDGVIGGNSARAAVLMHCAGQYLGTATVLQLIPRPKTHDEQLEDARRVLRADYWNDVRSVVDDVKSDISSRSLVTEDEVTEYIDQAVDGHQRVIYTYKALECLLFSDNEDAYPDQVGEMPSAESGGNWSTLAYYAFRQDVVDVLGDIDALLDAAKILCDDCDVELGDPDDKVIVKDADGTVESTLCSDCAAERQDDKE